MAGALLGWAAWGEGRTALLALMMPLCLTLVGGRMNVYLFAAGYHLAVLRGGIPFIGGWFDSTLMGVLAWSAFGVVGGLPWALAWWAKDGRPWTFAASVLGGFLLSLLPWFAVLQGGHPLYGWGNALPGWGWIGIGVAMAATAYAASMTRRERFKIAAFFVPVLFAVSSTQSRIDMRGSGPLIATKTHLGRPPTTDDEKMSRYEAVSRVLREAGASFDGSPAIVVLPETTLGLYDRSFSYAQESHIRQTARLMRVGVIVGREVADKEGGMLNQAVYVNTAGKEQVVNQRNPALLSMWAPWRADSFSIDWGRDNRLALDGGAVARVVICYEEYLPFLALLDEWRGGHNVVLAMANAWPTDDRKLSAVQVAHTEGMARLFGRKVVRSENLPAKSRKMH